MKWGIWRALNNLRRRPEVNHPRKLAKKGFIKFRKIALRRKEDLRWKEKVLGKKEA